MRIAYLDCASGISGDMFLGALIEAGLEPRELLEELKKLPLGFYRFKRTRAMRGGLVGARVEIEVPAGQPHRHLGDIEVMITQAKLAESTELKALAVFRRLAEAEGKLHNRPPDQIHFHEVGAVDAIIDIVGACIGLDRLEIGSLICSPLNVGAGSVEAAHGTLPVPAPATMELLKGVPVYSTGVQGELVTPTGAALVATLATSFGAMPAMTVERIGYGAGSKDYPSHPNIARIFVGPAGEAVPAVAGKPGDEVVSVIEANLDDMTPQLYGYLSEQALAAGALDVTCTPVQMKKNRPGFLISILCAPADSDKLAQMLFQQTTTIGLRIYEARRKVLQRQAVLVDTSYGPVNVKVAWLDGKVVNAAPEYEDCHRIATEKNVPLKEVMLAAQMAYHAKPIDPLPQ